MRGRGLFAICLLLCACGARPSWQDPAAPPGAQYAAYQGLRDAVYNCAPLQQIESLHAQALQALSAAGLPPRERCYWQSRAEYLIARGYGELGDKKRAVEHLERGLALIEEAMAEGSFSEGWRMRGELLGQLCLVKDPVFLLANGLKAQGYAEQALRMDPGNAAAQVIVASSKIYPPALLGGNPRLGIALMQKAMAMGPADPGDLFDIYSGLGQAYRKLKDFADARHWLAKALELFPGNTYVRRQYARLAP
jgi:tetratricopeptide (TPR) repeat protein